MTQSNNHSDSNPESADRVDSKYLLDSNIYGYRIEEKLSECIDRRIVTYLARDTELDRSVVIKEWRMSIEGKDGTTDRHIQSLDYANYLPEISRLQQLNHPNIPRYLNSFATPTGFCVVREYQSGVSLAELDTLPASDIQLVADAVLKILDDLHQLQPIVIHQNIKPENIIVNTEAQLTIYLVDFGLQSHTEDYFSSSTLGFLPLEKALNLDLLTNSDLYSLGVSLICLLTGTSTTQAKHLFDLEYHPQFRHLLPENTDPQAIERLEKMVEPKHRPKIEARNPDPSLDRSSTKLDFKFPERKQKIRWMRWGLGLGGLFGLGLIAMQLLLDRSELTPAQIAKNQEIADRAEFAASDRGKLLKDRKCIACQLDRQNFAKAELSGAILTQSSLKGINFSQANLSLAIFGDTDLSGADLSYANLRQAAFYGAKLIGTNLVGANLSNAKLVYAKFNGSRLNNVDLSQADLRFAEFQQVDFTGANLTGADLSNADLSYTNLQRAKLAGAKLDGTNLTGATMPDGSLHP
jgi:uncharacterized protein YjbI with pentapeptide repeats/tRNA A-37 threonylcarbamoyl transferase component Bud32